MSRRARARLDRGFTLVEMVVSVAVMGLLATTVAAVITVAFKNNPMAEVRTDVAHTLKGVVTWLPQDVDSTPPAGFNLDPNATTNCTKSPGKNILRMQWYESSGGTTTYYTANYRWVNTGSQEIIQRVFCWGTGTGPWGNTSVINASGALMHMPTSWAPGQLPARVGITYDLAGDGDVTLVAIDAQTASGDILHVDSAPKNPAHTLPPTTVDPGFSAVTTALATTTTTTPPSGTTTTVFGATTSTAATTTSTTIPACSMVGSTMSVATIKNTDPNGNGKASVNVGVLTTSVTVSVVVNAGCTGLDARAATGAPNSELFHNFTKVNASTFAVTFPGYPQGSSELWGDGSRVISFYSPNGTVIGSVTLVVK